MSQYDRFARICSNVSNFNDRHYDTIILHQVYRFHKFSKTFTKMYIKILYINTLLHTEIWSKRVYLITCFRGDVITKANKFKSATPKSVKIRDKSYSRLTWRVPLVEQELLTLPEHPSSLQVFSGIRVIRSLVLCVCLVDRCMSFCTFSFGHYVLCSSSTYGVWLLLWYLQALLWRLSPSLLWYNVVAMEYHSV